ncbi:MAG: hypothetical protein ABTQ25_15100 [Nitrosomonas ureae]
MHGIDLSKKLAPLLPQAFRQGVEAATHHDDCNPYAPNSYLYHAWIAGWATLGYTWPEDNKPRFS